MLGSKRCLALFCGARDGDAAIYAQHAYALGQALARRSLAVVYGGVAVGLMGHVANGCLAAGGYVAGVIPQALADYDLAQEGEEYIGRELVHRGLSELWIVETMHARKAKMADHGDGFIVLPGGLGTLDELFEILTWRQLGMHAKPIIIWNMDGYFNPLRTLIEHIITTGFAAPRDRGLLIIEDTLQGVLNHVDTLSESLLMPRAR